MPDSVERRFEDSFGGLDGELRPSGPRERNREGIRLEIRAVKKLGRVDRDTMPVVNPLEIGDKVWGDDGKSIRSDAELREECWSIAQGGGGRGFKSSLLGREMLAFQHKPGQPYIQSGKWDKRGKKLRDSPSKSSG